MTVALILLAALAAVGLPLYLLHRFSSKAETAEDQPEAQNAQAESEVCCGMHITCEKDSLLAAVSQKIEYYEDEELDRFAGRRADSYSPLESEEFREILLSTAPDDIAGWARSLQLRQIELPADVRDELLMIVAETRAARTLQNA